VENRLVRLIYSRNFAHPNDNTYHIVTRIIFSSEVHPLRLKQALRDLLEKNVIFSCYFYEQEHCLYVKSDASDSFVPASIPLKDISEVADEDAFIQERLEWMRTAPMSMRKKPLWKAELLCTADRRTHFLFCIHHSLFDGVSLNLMVQELALRYESLNSKSPSTLTTGVAHTNFNKPHWIDYCLWQAKNLESHPPFIQSFRDDVSYWKNKLAGLEARVALPVVSHFKRENSNQSVNVCIPQKWVQSLKRTAGDWGVTLSPLFFSIFLVWLWRLSDQSELICGYPCAGRDIAGAEGIYGCFVLMPLIRQKISSQDRLKSLVQSLHQQMLEDREHGLASPHDAEISGMDSLNVIFSLQTGIEMAGKFDGVSYEIRELPTYTSKADLVAILYHLPDTF
jgi:hypothetical protein